MKTISGRLISSKTISLSRAARNLSGFVGHENGASDAVSLYLKRTAEAFNRLVSFHKELKNPHPLHKHLQKHRSVAENSEPGKSEIVENRGKSKNNSDFGVKIDQQLAFELKTDLVIGVEDVKYLKDKRKVEKVMKVTAEMDMVGEEIEDQLGQKRKMKKHKRVKNEDPVEGVEQKAGEIEEGSVEKSEKKKRKKRDGEEEGKIMEVEERKSRGAHGVEIVDLAEQSSMKKRKRRKIEGEN
ncbi:hypothetical protein M9H77_16027 [Catharanthus roseus]|uniref:Uncharacterized protein n=1 Tax=Catharanthus roseus TaxID=4058 RepID=A0ACC0AZ59_CATRO|nr:hypothetical protein M9H77_16027 [Catharanthus roseus]